MLQYTSVDRKFLLPSLPILFPQSSNLPIPFSPVCQSSCPSLSIFQSGFPCATIPLPQSSSLPIIFPQSANSFFSSLPVPLPQSSSLPILFSPVCKSPCPSPPVCQSFSPVCQFLFLQFANPLAPVPQSANPSCLLPGPHIPLKGIGCTKNASHLRAKAFQGISWEFLGHFSQKLDWEAVLHPTVSCKVLSKELKSLQMSLKELRLLMEFIKGALLLIY